MSATASDYDGVVTNVALWMNDDNLAPNSGSSIGLTWSTNAVGWYTFTASRQIRQPFHHFSAGAIAITNATTATDLLTARISNLTATGPDALGAVQLSSNHQRPSLLSQGDAWDSDPNHTVAYQTPLFPSGRQPRP